MKYLFVFLSLGLMSCAPVPQNARNIDSILEPYVDAFETQTNHTFPVNIIVRVATPPGLSNEEGDCQMANGNGVSEIDIDPTFVSNELQASGNAYSYGLEQVVFHEIGHCILFRHHDSNLIAPGEPESIMYPYSFEGLGPYTLNYYINNRTYYIEELVNNFGK